MSAACLRYLGPGVGKHQFVTVEAARVTAVCAAVLSVVNMWCIVGVSVLAIPPIQDFMDAPDQRVELPPNGLGILLARTFR